MNNKISLIVPTSGQVENLIRCVESIQKQTKLPHEIFIIDNSQDRRVSQVLRRFRNKLPSLQIVKEREKGASFARNKGIQRAHYDILAFIDDDCIALPNWLEKLVLPFTKLSGDFVIKGENKNGLSASFIETVEYVRDNLFFKTSYYERNGALYSRWLDSKNFAIKKSTIIRHQLSFHNYYITEDLDFSLQLAQSEIPILVNKQSQVLHFAKRNLMNFFARSVQIGLDQQVLSYNWPGPILNTLDFNRYFFMSNKLTKDRSTIIDKQIEHVKLTFLHRLLLYLSGRLTFLTTLCARIFIHYPTCIIGPKDLSRLSNLPIHKRTQYLLNLYSSSYFFCHIQNLILKNDFTHAVDEVINFIHSYKSFTIYPDEHKNTEVYRNRHL